MYQSVQSVLLKLLYEIPSPVLLLTAVGLAMVLAGWGQSTVHRHLRRHNLIGHNEVGGIMILVAGTLYAVVLGFMTVVVWQHYIDARQLVVQEADADIDVWHGAVGLPDTVRARIRRDMVRYAHIMTEKEWPAMRDGRTDLQAAMVVMDAIDATGRYVPANGAEENAQQILLGQLTLMHDSRQQRVDENTGGVSGFEWWILIIGGTGIIMFCSIFEVRSPRIQFVMTSIVVTIIVSTLVLLFELQYPFRSDIGIGPGAWQGALAHLQLMEHGSMKDMRG